MKRTLILILFLIPFGRVNSQVNMDSLWTIWNNAFLPDTVRAKSLYMIAWNGYLYSKPDSAFYIAQVLYDFAAEKQLKEAMIDALNVQGTSFLMRSDFNRAMGYYKECLDLCQEISDKNVMARVLNNIGVIHSNQGNFAMALDHHQRSLALKQEISDSNGMAGSMNNIGLIFMNQGDYPKALDYFQKSLSIKEKFGDDRGIAQTLNNIGLIYMRQGEYSEALNYFQRSLRICEVIGDKSGSAGILSNIGLIQTNLSEYAKAFDYYMQSLKIREELEDKKGMASIYNNIGEIYSQRGDFSLAMDYFKKSLFIYEESADKKGMIGTQANIGSILNQQNKHLEAIEWCSKSLEQSRVMNMLNEQKNACQCLYDAYKAVGNNDKALEFHEMISILNDSLHAQETARKLKQMEFARQVLADSLKRQEEALLLQLEHEKEVRRKNRFGYILIFSAALLLMGVIALYRRIVFVRKAKKAIEHEKERSENLLLNILPAQIAEELKEKGKAEPRRFETVSIVFTDFKGFTKISEQMTAEDLVGEINTCFESFDSICKKYGIEKIKTMGDSFMAAGGIPVPSENAVKNTVLAGLEMSECMLKMKYTYQAVGKIPFEMRIGIHTGPAVAGIVGVTKFQYDIWGDTVNTASRIELAGEVGRVNISKSTYEHIKDDPDFIFIPRGMVQTKGKGEIEMWFVEKANHGHPANHQ